MDMDIGFYMRDPNLWKCFSGLSPQVRDALLRHKVYVSTVGELQMMADHYSQDLNL